MTSQHMRYDTFLAAAAGLTAHQTSVVMREIGTPGINWRGCSKRYMAEAYEKGSAHGTRVDEKVIAALRSAPRPIPKKRGW